MNIKDRMNETETKFKQLLSMLDDRKKQIDKLENECIDIEKQLLITKGEFEAYNVIYNEQQTASCEEQSTTDIPDKDRGLTKKQEKSE